MNSWRLNLGKYLSAHDITPYRLVKASGLASNTVYALARGPAQRIDLATVSTILATLEQLTGQSVDISEILESTPSTPITASSSSAGRVSARLPKGHPDLLLELEGLFNDTDSPTDVSGRVDEYLALAQADEQAYKLLSATDPTGLE
jgi:Cro/C1-type HTH DNA-binding domain